MYSGLCVGLGIADEEEEDPVVRLLLSLSSATVPPPPTSQACFLLPPKLASDWGSTVEQVPSSEVTAAVYAEDSVEVVESAGEGTGDASAESDMADADEATELAGEKAATS